MLLAGIALSALSAVAFLGQGGLGPILVGRVLSGLSAGIIVGTATGGVVTVALAAVDMTRRLLRSPQSDQRSSDEVA